MSTNQPYSPPVEILRQKTSYRGIILDVEEYDLDFGKTQSTFELIKFKVETGVSALALTEDNHVRLIRHFQLGAGKPIITLPSGGLAKGEDPATRMQLELQEEISCRAGKLTLMARSHILPGYIGTEPGYIFLAQELEYSILPGDEPYPIEVLSYPIDDAIKMIQTGEIIDGRTAYALLLYQNFFRSWSIAA